MTTKDKTAQWDNSLGYAKWTDYFRFFLGSFLFYIGMNYQLNPHDINDLVIQSGYSSYLSAVPYISLVNIIGGIMIAFGFKTRLAAIFQIPILVGAVTLYLSTGGQDTIYYSRLAVSIITLIMLTAFIFTGSGRYSVDGYLSSRNNAVHKRRRSQMSHF